MMIPYQRKTAEVILLFCALYKFKLTVIEIGIEALLIQQLLMRSLFNDIAVFHDQDQIGIADR